MSLDDKLALAWVGGVVIIAAIWAFSCARWPKRHTCDYTPFLGIDVGHVALLGAALLWPVSWVWVTATVLGWRARRKAEAVKLAKARVVKKRASKKKGRGNE